VGGFDRRYHDQYEDYVSMSRPLLRELSSFGWLQEWSGAGGMFFFSGAFWLLVAILAEHGSELGKYAPWLVVCLLSIVFGCILIWIGYVNFQIKQGRIQDISREHPTNNS
jgi:hypothetical protein